MFERLIMLIMIAAAGYWFWNDGELPSFGEMTYEEKLLENAETMRRCIRGESYMAGATGEGSVDPKRACAEQYNLYEEDRNWHSYDDVRPEK